MAKNRRSLGTLGKLLPAGVLGLSIGLAAAGAPAATSAGAASPGSVAQRLKAIRSSVSEVVREVAPEGADDPVQLAWWGNGWHRGWGNGGWHNWGNGGWHNWGNGWGNGGWHNWGNGWHNW
jgi:rSAM-associated Gly-rich repeat protein